jgi:hypothetical protein
MLEHFAGGPMRAVKAQFANFCHPNIWLSICRVPQSSACVLWESCYDSNVPRPTFCGRRPYIDDIEKAIRTALAARRFRMEFKLGKTGSIGSRQAADLCYK